MKFKNILLLFSLFIIPVYADQFADQTSFEYDYRATQPYNQWNIELENKTGNHIKVTLGSVKSKYWKPGEAGMSGEVNYQLNRMLRVHTPIDTAKHTMILELSQTQKNDKEITMFFKTKPANKRQIIALTITKNNDGILLLNPTKPSEGKAPSGLDLDNNIELRDIEVWSEKNRNWLPMRYVNEGKEKLK